MPPTATTITTGMRMRIRGTGCGSGASGGGSGEMVPAMGAGAGPDPDLACTDDALSTPFSAPPVLAVELPPPIGSRFASAIFLSPDIAVIKPSP